MNHMHEGTLTSLTTTKNPTHTTQPSPKQQQDDDVVGMHELLVVKLLVVVISIISLVSLNNNILIIMLRTLQRSSVNVQSLGRRAFSTDLFIPRVTERRLNEQGPGGRSTNAGVKVAVFGATGFLGKHVCNQLGTKVYI